MHKGGRISQRRVAGWRSGQRPTPPAGKRVPSFGARARFRFPAFGTHDGPPAEAPIARKGRSGRRCLQNRLTADRQKLNLREVSRDAICREKESILVKSDNPAPPGFQQLSLNSDGAIVCPDR